MPPVINSDTTVVVPMLEGVTTAIVAFIFVCVCFPTIVKNKTQFYGAFAAVMVVIFLYSLSIMIQRPRFLVFAGAVTGLLQIAAVVLLFLSCGGVTLKQFGGELSRAYEVIRRGEDEKQIIVPLTGEMPRSREGGATASGDMAAAIRDEEEALDREESAQRPPSAPSASRRDDSSLPLE